LAGETTPSNSDEKRDEERSCLAEEFRRRKALEVIIKEAARWGWNMKASGAEELPTAMIGWSDEGRPYVLIDPTLPTEKELLDLAPEDITRRLAVIRRVRRNAPEGSPERGVWGPSRQNT
jgi:hypothetical protein